MSGTEPLPTEDPGRLQLCDWCAAPVRQSGVGRARRYCRQACRQAAYDQRRLESRAAELAAAALEKERAQRISMDGT